MRKAVTIKIIVIDAQSIFLAGLLTKLAKFKEVKCTPVENGYLALKAMNKECFDLLLMDHDLPGMSGWEVMEKMKKLRHAPRVIIISNHLGDEEVLRGYRAGAAAFLSKHTTVEEIHQAICWAHRGDTYVTPAIGKLLLARVMKETDEKDTAANGITTFSAEQLEIMRLAHNHYTSEKIGKVMIKGTRTIEGYRSEMIHDLNVKKFTEVIAYAIKTGQLKEE